jgi:hypothetical protein
VLRTVLGSKWEEVTGGYRILHEEELHNMQSSPNIIRVTKPRMILEMNFTHMEMRNA